VSSDEVGIANVYDKVVLARKLVALYDRGEVLQGG
jgi:hypothetical protein